MKAQFISWLPRDEEWRARLFYYYSKWKWCDFILFINETWLWFCYHAHIFHRIESTQFELRSIANEFNEPPGQGQSSPATTYQNMFGHAEQSFISVQNFNFNLSHMKNERTKKTQ